MCICAAHDADQDPTLLRWFADLLLAVREGQAAPPPPTLGTPNATPSTPVGNPPAPLHAPSARAKLQPIWLLDHVYGDFNDARNTTEKTLSDCAILTFKNKDVEALNDHAVQSFPGEEKTYLLSDRLAQHGNEGRCLPHGALDSDVDVGLT